MLISVTEARKRAQCKITKLSFICSLSILPHSPCITVEEIIRLQVSSVDLSSNTVVLCKTITLELRSSKEALQISLCQVTFSYWVGILLAKEHLLWLISHAICLHYLSVLFLFVIRNDILDGRYLSVNIYMSEWAAVEPICMRHISINVNMTESNRGIMKAI